MSLLNDARQIYSRDPAARSLLGVIFLYSGFHALVYHRVSNFFYRHKLFFLARWNSQIARHKTGIEIHPGATIGSGLFIDHGMGIVIGETAVIGDNCVIDKAIIAEGVKIGNHVVLGAGEEAENDFAPHIYTFGLVTIGENSEIPDNVTIGKNVAIVGKTTIDNYPDNTLSSGSSIIKAGE